jgi:hypothetical protein
VIHLSGNRPVTLGLNYSEFPKSCLRGKLFFLKDSLQMLVDRRNADLKEFGHELLSQPDAFILKPTLDPGSSVLSLIEEDLPTGGHGLGGFLGAAHGVKIIGMPYK